MEDTGSHENELPATKSLYFGEKKNLESTAAPVTCSLVLEQKKILDELVEIAHRIKVHGCVYITEENKKARVNSDKNVSFNRGFMLEDVSQIKTDMAAELPVIDTRSRLSEKNGHVKGGRKNYGLKGGKKIENVNHTDEYCAKCRVDSHENTERNPTENSESLTETGNISTPIELPSRDDIVEVLQCIYSCFEFGNFCSDENTDVKHQASASEYHDQRSDTQNEETRRSRENADSKNMTLLKKINSLEREAKESLNGYEEVVRELKKNVDNLEAKINELELIVERKDEELRETLLQLGSLSVEHDKLMNESKSKTPQNLQLEQASAQSRQRIFEAPSTSDSSPSASESTLSSKAAEKSHEPLQDDPGTVRENPLHVIHKSSVQVSGEESSDGEGISLRNVPTTTMERSLFNNYKLLLLIMAPSLLLSDVVKLKEWARDIFSIDTSRNVIDIFWELDRKGVISALDLKLLQDFFEKILRFDLVHLIDCFMIGDYSVMRRASSSAFPRNGTGISNARRTSGFLQGTATGNSNVQFVPSSTSDGKNSRFTARNSDLTEVEESYVVNGSKLEPTTQNLSQNFPPSCSGEDQNISQHRSREITVTDGPAHSDNGTRNRAVGRKGQASTTENSTPNVPPATNHNSKHQRDFGSNGNKLSKFQKPEDSDDDSGEDDNEQWLCSHYKRRCHVKFACCDKFWPCHRCHNNESNCGQKKLKSIHTKFVKCVKCRTEQQLNENSQFCIKCHAKLAKYFCPICKHLTGKDDKPYHCEKCGICRIHKHRSFHCDVCGVCLDVKLRDNHKCRAGSAHDECCICLEDAFSGCQILPCSHKVHKECASQMIRNGITRCPICRESFAHKLEKRPAPKHGKK